MLIYQRVFFTNKHHFTNKPSEVLIRCGARMAGLFKSGALGDPDVVAWLTGGSSWFFWWVASGNNHLDNHLMGFIMGFNGIWWDSMGLTVCELENGTNDCDSMGDSMGFYSDWMGDNHLDNHLMGLRMVFFCVFFSNLMELMIVIQWDIVMGYTRPGTDVYSLRIHRSQLLDPMASAKNFVKRSLPEDLWGTYLMLPLQINGHFRILKWRYLPYIRPI